MGELSLRDYIEAIQWPGLFLVCTPRLCITYIIIVNVKTCYTYVTTNLRKKSTWQQKHRLLRDNKSTGSFFLCKSWSFTYSATPSKLKHVTRIKWRLGTTHATPCSCHVQVNEKQLRANQIISRTLAIMAIRGNQIMSYSKLQNKRFIISNRSHIKDFYT